MKPCSGIVLVNDTFYCVIAFAKGILDSRCAVGDAVLNIENRSEISNVCYRCWCSMVR